MTDRDPLDESNKQDRFDRDGDRWAWWAWCDRCQARCEDCCRSCTCGWTADAWDQGHEQAVEFERRWLLSLRDGDTAPIKPTNPYRQEQQ